MVAGRRRNGPEEEDEFDAERDGMTSLAPAHHRARRMDTTHMWYTSLSGRLVRSVALATLALLATLPRRAALVAAHGAPARSFCGEGTLGAVVESLPSLQSSKGGFGKPPSLQATQRALFLAQLYGMMPRINRERAKEFVTNALSTAAANTTALVADEEPPAAEGGTGANKSKTEGKAGNPMVFPC